MINACRNNTGGFFFFFDKCLANILRYIRHETDDLKPCDCVTVLRGIVKKKKKLETIRFFFVLNFLNVSRNDDDEFIRYKSNFLVEKNVYVGEHVCEYSSWKSN